MKAQVEIEQLVRLTCVVEIEAPTREDCIEWAIQRARVVGQVDWADVKKRFVATKFTEREGA